MMRMSSLIFTLICNIVIVKLLFSVSGSCFEVQSVPQSKGVLECPLWCPHENTLYWTNIFGHTVFRMDDETGEVSSRRINHDNARGLTSVKDYPGYLVLGVRTGVYLLKWGAPGDDKALRLLTFVDRGKPDNTIIDLKADRSGRLWIGTVGKYDPNYEHFIKFHQAALYTIDAHDFLHPVVKKRHVSLAKGMVWSYDNTKMYFNDAVTRKITAFDFDLKSGMIVNETVIFNFDDYDIPGIADGMTIDTSDNLWVATMTSKILNIDPRKGLLLRVIDLPVDQVTDMTWGGPHMDTLYVTTAALNVPHPKPMSGTILKVTNLGSFGYPRNEFVFPDASNY